MQTEKNRSRPPSTAPLPNLVLLALGYCWPSPLYVRSRKTFLCSTCQVMTQSAHSPCGVAESGMKSTICAIPKSQRNARGALGALPQTKYVMQRKLSKERKKEERKQTRKKDKRGTGRGYERKQMYVCAGWGLAKERFYISAPMCKCRWISPPQSRAVLWTYGHIMQNELTLRLEICWLLAYEHRPPHLSLV